MKKAIEEGTLAGIKSIGEKKIAAMKRALELAAQSAGRKGIGEVLPTAQLLVEAVRLIPGVLSAEIAGR